MRPLALLATFALSAAPPAAKPLPLPQGAPGIGFDDLRFANGQLLAPAGRTGALDVIDPHTLAITSVGGFTEKKTYEGGHDDSVTSADAGAGLLFATDRTARVLAAIDPASKQIVTRAALAGEPDYVRYVEATHELWVTEPDSEQIEIFKLTSGAKPAMEHAAVVAVKGGPESLAIDGTRGKAYAHLWKGQTVAVDLKKRALERTWANGCKGSRGIALDEARGWLFTGCAEGAVTLYDLGSGKQLGKAESGNGVDIIDYSASLGRVYLPGGKSETMAFVGVSAKGELSVLGTAPTAKGAHCVATDGHGQAFVCDPAHGQLLVFSDPYPPSGK
jgi:hypothetical protein